MELADVAIAWLPSGTGADEAGVLGPILSCDIVEGFEPLTRTDEPDALWGALTVTTARLDPCFLEFGSESTCRPQLRLSLQPVFDGSARDAAMHAFFDVDEETVWQAVARLIALRVDAADDGRRPLGISPLMQTSNATPRQSCRSTSSISELRRPSLSGSLGPTAADHRLRHGGMKPCGVRTGSRFGRTAIRKRWPRTHSSPSTWLASSPPLPTSWLVIAERVSLALGAADDPGGARQSPPARARRIGRPARGRHRSRHDRELGGCVAGHANFISSSKVSGTEGREARIRARWIARSESASAPGA